MTQRTGISLGVSERARQSGGTGELWRILGTRFSGYIGVVAVAYSLEGRMAFTAWHYPTLLSRIFPRACSDNVLLLGRKDGS